MYVVSQKDINTMMTNMRTYDAKFKIITEDDNVIDIENFNSIKALTIFILEFVLPDMDVDDVYYLHFHNPELKPILDKIIKKYYLRIKYCGIKNKTRIYRVHP